MDLEKYIDRLRGGFDGSCDMPQCASCKHWNAVSSLGRHDFGECARGSSESGRPRVPETLAFAEDCESYCAELHTKSDFSCIQWEPKDA